MKRYFMHIEMGPASDHAFLSDRCDRADRGLKKEFVAIGFDMLCEIVDYYNTHYYDEDILSNLFTTFTVYEIESEFSNNLTEKELENAVLREGGHFLHSYLLLQKSCDAVWV